MIDLIFVVGPNGVGKSTTCEALHRKLQKSAWIESEWCRMINPFVLNEDAIPLTISNMSSMLINYLNCNWLDYIILPYGFHGARKQIWEAVYNDIKEIDFNFVPITLTCTEHENKKRMIRNKRSETRIQRALLVRHVYSDLRYPIIDTTDLSVDEVTDHIIDLIQSSKPN